MPYSFTEFISDPKSEIVLDFSYGTNFDLKFPTKRIPRFIIPPGDSNHKQSIEAIAWKLYPDLGRTQRPDNLNLQEYVLDESDKDFCKIASIPYDVLVKLNPNTKCSCSVYYLYRIVRKYFLLDSSENNLNWLGSVSYTHLTHPKKREV